MKKTMRLDKMLGNLGYGTRSGIKQLVRQGAVTVNGARAKDAGMQIDPERDEIQLDGERVVYRDTVYVMLNKPAGYVSATEDARDRTVLELLPEELSVFSPFPVGRLDKDTEGLLLLTNDGKLSHELLSPRKHVPKTYRALVAGEVGEPDARAFSAGVALDDGYVTLPAALRVLSRTEGAAPFADDEAEAAVARLKSHPPLTTNRAAYAQTLAGDGKLSWIELTIHEGKFHQVKRMFQAVGKQVLYLRRVAMGPMPLDPGLSPGEWRELADAEVDQLRNEQQRRGTTS
ncbi:pseudouridine synthase [Cohnella nanjingensis]|uniref:Pseudouridine synthase n=1 Tax=Cohnella nanjingensis TaxID=1387779 RepID=A0A7X0VHN9_9BACL|nr:pseudouridine synthase [Cohnella nanjingensis]MBB6674335.1 rRNA pseudouridine synthase [Cohnella nanjingensis]